MPRSAPHVADRSPGFTRSRRGWRLAGVLVLHVVLGVGLSGVAFADWASKAHWELIFACNVAPTATSVHVAALTAFATWWLAGVVMVWLWAAKRRFTWLPSVVWTGFNLIAILTVIAVWQQAGGPEC